MHVGWLCSRVVSMLDSGAERPGFKSHLRHCRVTVLGKLFTHTHRASVHQAAKLVAALLRVAGVTLGLAESNGSLPPGLWLTSPAGWLLRTGISSWTLRSVIEYVVPFFTYICHCTVAVAVVYTVPRTGISRAHHSTVISLYPGVSMQTGT